MSSLEVTSEAIRTAFEETDADKSGYISLLEAQSVLKKKFNFPPDQTRRLMQACDKNNDGELSYNEFVEFYEAVHDKLEEIRTTFDKFDTNHDGLISPQEAKAAMTKMGFKPSQVDALVTACDTNKDGKLQYDEFVNFWLIK